MTLLLPASLAAAAASAFALLPHGAPAPAAVPAAAPAAVVAESSTPAPRGGLLSWLFGTFFICHLDGSEVVPPTTETSRGISVMWLDQSGTHLFYWLVVDGVVIETDFAQRTAPEDVTRIHFHLGAPGQNGPHLLNVFGLPSEDDLDMRVREGLQMVSGIWDDGDAFVLQNPGIGDTRLLSDHVDDLCDGDAYLQVHTNRHPNPGEIRGQIQRLFW